MRTLSTCTALASVVVIVAACQPRNQADQGPNGMPTGYPGQAQPGQYPPGQYPPGQVPPGYPAPTATYPQPMATATGPMPMPGQAPTGSGQMAVPGPLAFQCQNDVPCGLHHCNTQYGKCAFPCQTAADCISPNQCIAGLCVPTPPQAH